MKKTILISRIKKRAEKDKSRSVCFFDASPLGLLLGLGGHWATGATGRGVVSVAAATAAKRRFFAPILVVEVFGQRKYRAQPEHQSQSKNIIPTHDSSPLLCSKY
jgi:hypothetical protein